MLAALALGSNLPSTWGSPADALHEAVHRLTALGIVKSFSSLRETAPVGLQDQPDFTNAAALLETSLGPLELLRALLAIERGMGRLRDADLPPKGPRVIDLDLLLYQNADGRGLILDDPDLTLPHPALQDRSFVLEPLSEIAPDWTHPLLEKTIAQLWAQLQVNISAAPR